MSTNNDGGPAFPYGEISEITGQMLSVEPGMTLRDYFAAKAMQGMMASGTTLGDDDAAFAAYAIADAMLKAREAK